MTQPNVVDARLVRIWRGTPQTPTNANNQPICAMTTRGLNQTKQSNTAVIPDCDDPTVVAPVKRTMLSKDAVLSGTGFYLPEKRSILQAIFDKSTSEPFSIEIPSGEAAASEGGWYTGNFFLTTFNITAEEGNFVQAEMTWEVDGPISWVAGEMPVPLP